MSDQKPLFSENDVQWLLNDNNDNTEGIGALDSDEEKSILNSESLLSDGDINTNRAEQPIFLEPVVNRGWFSTYIWIQFFFC